MFTIFYMIATIIGASAIIKLFDLQGYTRLVGLPHLIFGIHAAFVTVNKLRTGLPMAPRVLMIIILATISISLVFDVFDLVRYVLGARESMAPA